MHEREEMRKTRFRSFHDHGLPIHSKSFESRFQHPLLLSLIHDSRPGRRNSVLISPSIADPHLRPQPLRQKSIHPRLDVRERSLVLRLLLYPNDLSGFRVPLQRGVEVVEWEGRKFFQPDERDPLREVPGLTFFDEVVVQLSGEDDDAVDFRCVGNRIVQDGFEPSVWSHFLERGRRSL